MKQKLYLGIDMGGSNVKGGLVTPHGKIIKQFILPTPRSRRNKDIVFTVNKVVEYLINFQRPFGIGLGWPGTANVPLKGKIMKKVLEKKFKLPVLLENDANCFALGEALLGKGKKYSIVLGITIGTGIGCGLVINKKIYRGKGRASELGHTTFDFQGPVCECGSRGCFEQYVGKKGLKRLAEKYNLRENDGLVLFQQAKRGNKKALKIWQEMGKLLGLGIVNAINAYDPEIIILGGKISGAWRFFKKEMENEIRKRSFIKHCPIKTSNLANSAIVGAAALIFHNNKHKI